MLTAFTSSTLLIALAEMGDKTQLLALSFATKYKPARVLGGIFLATVLVHLLSVIAGAFLSGFVPTQYLRIVVGISFIGFAAWTLRGDESEEASGSTGRFGVVMTVAVAFFLAELGDKTQLATISLAAQYRSLLQVWMGSSLGMVIADGLAIGVGIVAGKRIPEHILKYASAAIFAIFGVVTVIEGIKPLLT